MIWAVWDLDLDDPTVHLCDEFGLEAWANSGVSGVSHSLCERFVGQDTSYSRTQDVEALPEGRAGKPAHFCGMCVRLAQRQVDKATALLSAAKRRRLDEKGGEA